LFVQPDGTLGEEAVAQLPETWNTIFVGDQHIIPDSVYEVQSDCSAIFPGLVSQSIPVSTKVWADVTEDGEIDFSDVLLIIDGTDGNFRDGATLQSLDLFPCIPDRVINEDDISVVKDAMIFYPFPVEHPVSYIFLLRTGPVF